MSSVCSGNGCAFSRNEESPRNSAWSVQLVPGELHEQALEAVEVGFRVFVPNLELFSHFVVEVLQQLLAGAWSSLR